MVVGAVFMDTYTVHCVLCGRGKSCFPTLLKTEVGAENQVITDILTLESAVETAFYQPPCFLLFLRHFEPKIGVPTNRC